MGWGWLCYAKTGRFVATFSTVSRFLLPFRAESGTAAKFSFCNGPYHIPALQTALKSGAFVSGQTPVVPSAAKRFIGPCVLRVAIIDFAHGRLPPLSYVSLETGEDSITLN